MASWSTRRIVLASALAVIAALSGLIVVRRRPPAVADEFPVAEPRAIYVVSEACRGCFYQDCVEVCPTDAFRDAVETLVIDPDACIGCGLCEPECPANAIMPAFGDNTPDYLVGRNALAATAGKTITRKGESIKRRVCPDPTLDQLPPFFRLETGERFDAN